MIGEIEKVPVSRYSYPFQTAVRVCALERHGYEEEEYFMSGTANVYTETGADHKTEVLYPEVPYTTRLLVRRPKNKMRFSGNVVLEILNASAGIDIDRMWVNTWRYLVRNGDIYIGITSKGHVVDALKRFDPKRYEPINWKNPDKGRKPPEKTQFVFLEEYESGLYWDMQNDLARLLRTEDEKNFLRGWGKRWLYLLGWSQSGSYMTRTLVSFAGKGTDAEEQPLFDGYLEAGADAALAPINAYEMPETNGRIGRDGTLLKNGTVLSREPYIALNTESEHLGASWGEDQDRPECKFRAYEIAGTSHDSYYNMIEYYRGHLCEDAKRAGCELAFPGAEGKPLAAPYEFIFQAALRNLYCWVREGVPAPHAPRIKRCGAGDTDADGLCRMSGGKNLLASQKDVFGNTAGGIRLASQDFPAGVYKSESIRADGSKDPMFGTLYPFSPELLRNLYGTSERYRALVEKSAEESIALGFLMREDKKEYVERTVRIAQECGLV